MRPGGEFGRGVFEHEHEHEHEYEHEHEQEYEHEYEYEQEQEGKHLVPRQGGWGLARPGDKPVVTVAGKQRLGTLRPVFSHAKPRSREAAKGDSG